MSLKTILKKNYFIKKILADLNYNEREEFIVKSLQSLDGNILDAGCGSQRYKKYCSHLNYKSQDFGLYKTEEKIGFASDTDKYNYGKLDYQGDIWNIDEVDNYFDNIICTEVFEHIPYPIETVKEFSRLLKPGGKLILTAPSNCLRHMDPYFFYTGFSDNWYDKILKEYDFKLLKIETVGDYYSWMKVEIYRTMSNHSFLAKILLFPTFLFFKSMKKTQISKNTLCMGYHIIAEKNNSFKIF